MLRDISARTTSVASRLFVSVVTQVGRSMANKTMSTAVARSESKIARRRRPSPKPFGLPTANSATSTMATRATST